MPLFTLPNKKTKTQEKENKIKLKKGETMNTLIFQAETLVNEKLGKYKDVSKCIIDPDELRKFFKETDDLLALDTETTRIKHLFRYFSRSII